MADIPRPVVGSDGDLWIHPADQVSFREAQSITGRSQNDLKQLAARGQLTCVTGRVQRSSTTRLSRYECEDLALAAYGAGGTSDYWLTMSEAAVALGVARQNAYKARTAGRLPTFQAANGALLVRRIDVEALLLLGHFRQ